MGYHPRIESPNLVSFITTRSRNSRLWFINNPKLEERILAYIAKYTSKYHVKLYALAVEGNHIHLLAKFPLSNRSIFMRDLNSIISKLVPKYTKKYLGGTFWARRYSQEFIPDHKDDIEDRFFYTVLQPVQDGLVSKISDYPGYNCFNDAVSGISRKYKTINWTNYQKAKRKDLKVSIKDFEETHTLTFSRIDGYENLSQREYKKLMHTKLEERRVIADKERSKENKTYLGVELLKQIEPGSLPKSTKSSTRHTKRPRVLSVCPLRRQEVLGFYFDCYNKFKQASHKLRNGIIDAIFPQGMFKPFLHVT